MKRPYLLGGLLAALAFALSACASLPKLPDGSSQILSNLEGCDRHYEGIVQGVSFSGKVEIDCKAARPAE